MGTSNRYNQFMSRLLENLNDVRERAARAAQRSGRTASSVTLVAVTKYVDVAVIEQLIAAGCHDLGEARPQVLWQKAAAICDNTSSTTDNPATKVRWHMIGHLQRNKVEPTLPLVSLIHSGDSLRLIAAIDAAAAVQQRTVDLLLEINISGDETKHGFTATELEPLLPQIASFESLRVRGLMAMAGREGDLNDARRDFVRLRELREKLLANLPPGISLDELSMGMSDDFEIAIEEGATLVRVGSSLYEGLVVK